MQKWGILGIGVLVVGLFTIGFGVQDVYGPQPQPEKIQAGPVKPNGDGFDVHLKVFLPKGVNPEAYIVDTTLELFKPDGIPIRATVSVPVLPTQPAEGGENSRVHKLIGPIRFVGEDSREFGSLEGERVKVEVSTELINPSGRTVDAAKKDGFVKLIFD